MDMSQYALMFWNRVAYLKGDVTWSSIAKALNMSYPNLCHYRSKSVLPNPMSVYIISRTIGTTTDELLKF